VDRRRFREPYVDFFGAHTLYYNAQLEVDLNSQLNLALKLRSQIYEAIEDLDHTIDPTGESNRKHEEAAPVYVYKSVDLSSAIGAVIPDTDTSEALKSQTEISLFPLASAESARTTSVGLGYFSHGELLRKNVEA
jgi:hypothetical protein